MIACLTLDLMWLLLWNWCNYRCFSQVWRNLGGHPRQLLFKGESTLESDQAVQGCICWVLKGGRSTIVSEPLLQCLFILWEKSVFLVSRLNYYFTVSHPPAMQHCEDPGSAASVFRLTPPLPSSSLVTPTTEARAVIASLQLLAVLLFAQPSMLLAFLAAPRLTCPIQETVKLGPVFMSPSPWEVCPGKSGISLKLVAHKAKASARKGSGNNPCEIPHMNFAAGVVRGN